MKKAILFSLIALLNFNHSFSQDWEWSRKIPRYENISERGMFTDWDGRIYCYGSGYFDSPYATPLTDTVGSFLACYSPEGALIYYKHWAIPFYITKMAYDRFDQIYFSATFYGSQTISGISIMSEGDSDGAVGRMDTNGNLLWISTFGGTGKDNCAGITFNASDRFIYATGAIKTTLKVDHILMDSGEQSAIVLQYNNSGNLVSHKRYDYKPLHDVYDANKGLEIGSNQQGDLYVLMDLDGRTPGDPVTADPEMGRYLLKLNDGLDTIWSEYIIGPACYYGYSCNNLSVAASGDIYLAKRCDHKYGGDASLIRLSASTGKIIWDYPNSDGRYNYIAIDSNTVSVLGIEGAYACPCPANNFGYPVLKIFDENNVLIKETRPGIGLVSMAYNNTHDLYIRGGFSTAVCVVGPDTLMADTVMEYSVEAYRGACLCKFGTTGEAPVLATSINNYEDINEFNVFPNPAGNSFTMHCKSNKTCELKMMIYDAIGNTIYSESIPGFSGAYDKMFDLGTRPKGIYLLTVEMEDQRQIRKVILQ